MNAGPPPQSTEALAAELNRRWGAYIDEASYVATQAHTGQVDKQGAPYIGHPRAVAEIVSRLGGSGAQIAAAWLHDVVEDHGEEAAHLHRFPDAVGSMVLALTRRPGESYHEFIERLVFTPAALVKFADLTHNTDPDRGPIPESLVGRYERAKRTLLGL